jgi:hypothetical protein
MFQASSSMNGNIRFNICSDAGHFKVVVAYENEEVAWGPYQTLVEIADRIRTALENLDKQKL